MSTTASAAPHAWAPDEVAALIADCTLVPIEGATHVALYDREGRYLARVTLDKAASVIVCGGRAFVRSPGGHFAEASAAFFERLPE